MAATKAQVIAYIRRVARSVGVPPAIALAVAQTISGFDPDAVNADGSLGVFGLSPAETPGLDPAKWRQNVELGIRRLQHAYRASGHWQPAVHEVSGSDGGAVMDMAVAQFGYRQGNTQGGGGGGGSQNGTGGGQGGGGGGGGADTGYGSNGPDIGPDELRSILRGFGLNPRAFDDLIHDAVVGQWTPYQFEAALYESDPFHKMFPGIFNAGGSLKMTPGQYLQLVYGPNGYRDISHEFGVKINRKKIGQLIEGNVDPEEWADRAQLRSWIRENPEQREAYDAALKAMGRKGLDETTWFKALSGETNQDLQDLEEAARLQLVQGLDIDAGAAVDAARLIGQPGEKVNLNQLVNQARSIKDFISPELQAAGISDVDLVVLQGGADPKNLGPKLEQIVNNRKALLGAPRTRLTAAAGGMFPETREGF